MKTRKPREQKLPRKEVKAVPKQRPEFWLWSIGLLFGLFAAFQVYSPALHGPFLFDDSYLPMNVPAWANTTFLESFRGVRPLLMASYWINSHTTGSDTSPYHVWNVFLHFLNAA